MSKTAASSGGAGDIVYSIPVLKKLFVDVLYVKETKYDSGVTLYETVKPLIESQGIQCLPADPGFRLGKFDPELKIDYNLDNLRNQPLRGKNHIIKSYCQEFGLSTDGWNKPFLEWKDTESDFYSLIHLTPRWRERSTINWKAVYASVPKPVFFIGWAQEYIDFCKIGRITFEPCRNLLEMASLIANSRAVYCNQSVALAIAQGLGKEYWLERKPGKSNTLFYTKNEHIL